MPGLPKRLRDLDAALAALGDEAMILSQFDGYVAGLLLCPELILPSEWLPGIWGEDEEPGFDDPAHAETVTRLMMAHYNDVADILRRRPSRYGPLYDVYAPTEETFWEFWIEGFEDAMSLKPSAWLPLTQEKGDAAQALALLLTLAGIARKDPELVLDKARVDELSSLAPDLIGVCVISLAIRQFGPSAAAVPPSKVGRNDPCPCGSGKKYKKCCGAA